MRNWLLLQVEPITLYTVSQKNTIIVGPVPVTTTVVRRRPISVKLGVFHGPVVQCEECEIPAKTSGSYTI